METDEQGNIKVDIEKLNILDKQAGIYNSDFFCLRLNEEIKRATRYDLYFSFIMIEFKDRKEVFEKLEEEDIEIILKEMGYNIKDSIRGDIDLAGHIEEGLFGLILPETDIQGAHTVSGRIKSKLEKALNMLGLTEKNEDLDEYLLVNIGITEVPEDANTSNLVIKRGKRSLLKSNKDGTDGIGLTKAIEKYPQKKKKVLEEAEKKDEDKKASDYYMPFLEIVTKGDLPETEKPDEQDVKILKEIEKQKILYGITLEGETYLRKPLNAFGAVKLLNQKKFIYIEDSELKTAIPCITPQTAPEVREKILQENIRCAGALIYSYKELKIFNGITGLTPYNTEASVSMEDRTILEMLEHFKGFTAIDGKWIVDPSSPFDPMYMMVRRRFIFKVENTCGIYYHDLLKDNDKETLYPIFPNCRLSTFEALRLIKKGIAIEIITEGGHHHIIHNKGELELLYQVEAG